MELVYLWVKNYKNIKNQGFNFSPRFECEFFPKYDKDGKLEDNCELKITPKDYVSIFPDNINITAIVGENGSGKSRILETFTKTDSNFLFYDENFNVLNLQDIFDVSLFNDNVNSYLYKNNSNVTQQILKKFTLYENATDQLQFKINNLTISFLSQIGNINSDIHFSPTHIELIFSKKIALEEINTLNGVMIIYSNTMLDTTDRRTINISNLQTIKEMFEQKIKKTIEIQDIKSYLLLKEFIHRIKQKDNSIFKYFSHSRMYNDDDNIESVFEFIYRQFLEEHSDMNFNRIVQILQDSIKEVFNSEKIILNYKDNDFKEIEILLANIHRGYFNLKFFVQKEDDVLYFNDLSDGEQQLLLIFSKIYYLIRTIYKDSLKKLIFLIDEPDTFLHPNWQRKFFANLYEFITNIEIFKHKKFHFIVTSHSPFILSDLPKENVIFLEKYKEKDDDEVKNGNQKIGNCKNVTKDIKLKTFGANIHTLLSDGFFMSDGLMGEFAKNKIRTIQITYKYILHRHKQKSLNKKEHKKSRRFIKTQLKMLWHIQSIIGERFLQTIMKNYLQEIEEILFGNEKAINNEIERLENLKQSIKNVKNKKS
ncbi:AAA family ATPase [Aliarcobacter butzleri]